MAKDRGAIGGLLDFAGGIGKFITSPSPGPAAEIAGQQIQNEAARQETLRKGLAGIIQLQLDPKESVKQFNDLQASLGISNRVDTTKFFEGRSKRGTAARKLPLTKTVTKDGSLTETREARKPVPQSQVAINEATGEQGTIQIGADGVARFTPIQTDEGALQATQKQLVGTVPGEAISKGTQTKIEKDVVDLQTTLTELDSIEGRFNEDFFITLNLQDLTSDSKAKAAVTAIAEKFNIPVSEASKKFLSEKTTFFADSKRVFLRFRKFITGVAGGIEEFREIAKATIDPEKDSATQFRAKLNSMRDNAIRTRNVLLAIRNSGLDENNPEIQKLMFKGISLESIPTEIPQDITIDTLRELVDLERELADLEKRQ